MKKAIIYAMLFAIPAWSFAQSTEKNLPAVKTDYLKKSKSQKIAAWSLLGGGFVIFMATAATASSTEEGEQILGPVYFNSPEPNYTTGQAVLLTTGTAAMLASIPFFIASGKNKKKAMSMTSNIKMEKATIFERQSFVQSSYPAIAFKINL